jgi:Kef-type K+ transport system membrane component KefB
MEALYVAVALTFSSTIIIVKLLSDKRELDSACTAASRSAS